MRNSSNNIPARILLGHTPVSETQFNSIFRLSLDRHVLTNTQTQWQNIRLNCRCDNVYHIVHTVQKITDETAAVDACSLSTQNVFDPRRCSRRRHRFSSPTESPHLSCLHEANSTSDVTDCVRAAVNAALCVRGSSFALAYVSSAGALFMPTWARRPKHRKPEGRGGTVCLIHHPCSLMQWDFRTNQNTTSANALPFVPIMNLFVFSNLFSSA